MKTQQFDIFNIKRSECNALISFFRRNKYTETAFAKMHINQFSPAPLHKAIIQYYFQSYKKSLILYALFYLGESLSPGVVDAHFTKSELSMLRKFHLLQQKKTVLRAEVMIIPFENLYFMGDFLFRFKADSLYKRRGNRLVYPVSSDSVDLWRSVCKKPYSTGLDVCTGCGVHAILLARYTKKVVGTDINPRAINFARFNALLNNVTNVKFIVSDLFDAVGKEEFDIVLANVPYVAVAQRGSIYFDGGTKGDALLKRFLAGIGEYMTKEARCHVVGFFYQSTRSNYYFKYLFSNSTHRFRILFAILYQMDPVEYVLSIFRNRTSKIEGAFSTLQHLAKQRVQVVYYALLIFNKAKRDTVSPIHIRSLQERVHLDKTITDLLTK